jgi:hypothetical protein
MKAWNDNELVHMPDAVFRRAVRFDIVFITGWHDRHARTVANFRTFPDAIGASVWKSVSMVDNIVVSAIANDGRYVYLPRDQWPRFLELWDIDHMEKKPAAQSV